MTLRDAVSRFRSLSNEANWEPDKQYALKGNVIRYCSIGKLKRTVSPLLVKSGLEMSFRMEKVEDLDIAVRLHCTFVLTDVVTGESDETPVIADGSRMAAEKAVQVAMSYAMRTFLLNRFLIIDGIDFDDGYSEDIVPQAKPVPIAPAVKDKADIVRIPVVPKAVPPAPVTATVPQNTATAPKVVAPGTVPAAPKKEDEPVQAQAQEKTAPTVEEAKEVVSVTKLSPMECLAASKAMDSITTAFKSGHIVGESYDHAKAVFESIQSGNGTAQDVFTLVSLRRELEDRAPPAEEGM